MVTLATPRKTPEGLAELTARSRGLTQRHRTLLLLIDGQRPLDHVLHLAHHAGVPRNYMDELLSLGLVAMPPATDQLPTMADIKAAVAAGANGTASGDLDIELHSAFTEQDAEESGPIPGQAMLAAQAQPSDEDDDLDNWDEDLDTEGLGRELSTSELAALDSADHPLADARRVLLQALRQEAPVAGAMTMLRVRRAANREALVALLPEV